MMGQQARDAAGIAARNVGRAVVVLGGEIDAAHRIGGLAIPPAVSDALETLTALALAWASNSQGNPAPDHLKAALGLETAPPTEQETPKR